MRTLVKAFALIALLVLALAGCGGGGGSSNGGGGNGDAGAPPEAEGMSVEEAWVIELLEPGYVHGILVESDGELLMCDSVMETDPPTCSEPFLTVVGSTLPGVPRGEDVSVFGTVEEGTITPVEE